MRGLTFQGKQVLQVLDLPEPKIVHATDVIIKIESAGICGSDLHPYHEREKGLDHGTVMGHEAVGVVVEKGADVRKLHIDDRVMVPFTSSCGTCFYCLEGLTCRCISGQLFGWVERGKGLNGLQAQYARIPLADTSAVKVPRGLSSKAAVLVGDVIPTGMFCADMAEARPGKVIVVLGCGPIGLSATASVKDRGVERIFAVDAVAKRLHSAAGLGAKAVSLVNESIGGEVSQVTQGRGADAVIDAVGSPEAQALAFQLLRPGGIIATAGVHTSPAFSFSPINAYDKNITYRVGRCPARKYMEQACSFLERGVIAADTIISHELPLSAGPQAYRMFDLKEDGCTKVVLNPWL